MNFGLQMILTRLLIFVQASHNTYSGRCGFINRPRLCPETDFSERSILGGQLTYEMLVGEGEWAEANKQATLPVSIS